MLICLPVPMPNVWCLVQHCRQCFFSVGDMHAHVSADHRDVQYCPHINCNTYTDSDNRAHHMWMVHGEMASSPMKSTPQSETVETGMDPFSEDDLDTDEAADPVSEEALTRPSHTEQPSVSNEEGAPSIISSPLQDDGVGSDASSVSKGINATDESSPPAVSTTTKPKRKRNPRKRKPSDPVHCSICFKSYSSQSSLNRHMSTHDDNKPKCELCGEFYSGGNKTRHIREFHEGIPRATILMECSDCHHYFSSARALEVHKKGCQSGTPSYICEICGLACLNRGGLTKHIQCRHPTND